METNAVHPNFLAPGEEREEPMSSTPTSDDEHPEVEDEAVSDRIPTILRGV